MTTFEKQIQELGEFFLSRQLPEEPIKINGYMTVTDAKLFVQSQFKRAENYHGNEVGREGTLKHLKELREAIERTEVAG
jgi:hypothetical protein